MRTLRIADFELRSAGFQTCCIADFQIGRSYDVVRPAGLETCATGDLEVCATVHSPCCRLFAIFMFFLSAFSSFAAENSLTDAQLLQIKYDQKPGSQVSPDLVFRDETGKQVRLGDYFGKRPIVLIPGYYSCPMLCSLVMEGVIESFRDLRWNVGEQFDVVFVSIDPREGPALAAAKKKLYLRDYGRDSTVNGWHFLVAAVGTPLVGTPRCGVSAASSGATSAKRPSDASSFRPLFAGGDGGGSATGEARRPCQSMPLANKDIQTLADEIGFHFAYDGSLNQFAHPSGFVVLTPEGKVAHYFFGVTFSAKEVDAALRHANAKKTDSPVRDFILLCCEYSPLRGRYGNLVMDAVRAGGVGMAVALGVYFVRPVRRKSG